MEFKDQQVIWQNDQEHISKEKKILKGSEFLNYELSEEKSLLIQGSTTLAEVQGHLKEKQFSLQDLTAYYGKRIMIYDSKFNSVIALNTLAMSYAKTIDDGILSKGQLQPLTGCLVLIKDNIADQDMKVSAGALALKNTSSKRDSFIVDTLKKQGAIILGKNNLSELSNFMTSPSRNGYSALGGQTKNPYGPYDVGGSSSGPCVAATLGFSTVTIGTETCGSLVYPASQNSVVTIKPTMGFLSRDLIIPITEAQDSAGVIGRNVEDVRQVFASLVKADEKDKAHTNLEGFDLSLLKKPMNKLALNGKKVGLLNKNSHEYRAFEKDLLKVGAQVVKINLPEEAEGLDMMPILCYGMKNDMNAFLAHKAIESDIKNLKDLMVFNEKNQDLAMPFGQSLIEKSYDNDLTKEAYESIVFNNRKGSRDLIDHALKEYDIDVIASLSNDLSAVFAPAEYPAVTVPAGYLENGEPFGLTFVGTHQSDATLLEFAYAYEQVTQHRKEVEL